MSTQILISLLCFSKTTRGLTQLVESLTVSMTCSSSNCFYFSATFCRLLNGMRLKGCAKGATPSFWCNLSWEPLSFPRPSKPLGNVAFGALFLSRALAASWIKSKLFTLTPTLRAIRISEVLWPNKVATSPGTSWNSATDDKLDCGKVTVNSLLPLGVGIVSLHTHKHFYHINSRQLHSLKEIEIHFVTGHSSAVSSTSPMEAVKT